MAKVVILMADKGHDPTETTLPYYAFKNAGFDVKFATEKGDAPECDPVMLRGITQRLLGAQASVVKQYDAMAATDEFRSPLAWTEPSFSLAGYDLVFLPGGHEKSVRQIIDSGRVHRLLAEYVPLTRRPSRKALAAVCHGVMVLSAAKVEGTGEGGKMKSVIADCVTTTLPARFEQVAFWGTRAFLGDYYKTYGAGSEDVEDSVVSALADKSQYKRSLLPTPFVVEDPNYNYISARFPGDVALMGEKIVKMVQSLQQ
ncbi:hypothetical protein N3K66_005773 [Trichothecium roseum]|uniref:Uncharacterized protein n=1 Tax=Trichothecium roseum TaxID=47278 RepID=A0ACC0V0Q0_9HYPO|nr:hypothetical protein N3K66_005773 [Trichothecium roseum]